MMVEVTGKQASRAIVSFYAFFFSFEDQNWSQVSFINETPDVAVFERKMTKESKYSVQIEALDAHRARHINVFYEIKTFNYEVASKNMYSPSLRSPCKSTRD